MVDNSSLTMLQLKSDVPVLNLLGCARLCVDSPQHCYSFIYHTVSRLCTTGTWLVASTNTSARNDGVLYSNGAYCSSELGFQVISRGLTTVCVWLSSVQLGYIAARDQCKAKGAHLYTPKTQEKLDIFLKIALSKSSLIWIGLNCFAKVFEFVWEDDGTVMQKSWWTVLFHAGCPSTWHVHDDGCYQFNGDTPRTFDQATVACARYGAGLVSVTDSREDEFIARWLQINDPSLRSWYTSGKREAVQNGGYALTWQGTGDDVTSPDLLMLNETQSSLLSGVIVYKHFDYGFHHADSGLSERGPGFLYEPRDTVVVGNPLVAELECVVIGNPHPVYSWWRGDNFQILVTSELDQRYTLTNGKLIIDNPREDLDGGVYKCRAENRFGAVVSRAIRLSFGEIGEFSNVPDAPVNVKAYEGAAIDCSRISYRPAISYNWFKQNVDQFVRPQYQHYMFISHNGKLYFSEVTRADEGKYFCLATLTGGNQHTIGTTQPPSRTSLPIMLHVHDQAPKAIWGPEIQDEFIAVFPKPPLAGHDVRMECFAYGSSTSEFLYSWHRQNKSLPANSYQSDHGRVLTIRDARLEDQGVYTCSVTRSSSTGDRKSVDLKLGAKPYFIKPLTNQYISAKPYFIKPLTSQYADIGSQLTWRCDAGGVPAPVFQWYRNGELLNSSADAGIRVHRNVLTFHRLEPTRHNGMYQCSATNTHGTSLSEGQLLFLGFKPSFLNHPLPKTTWGPVGGNVTIVCRPEGAPMPDITWYKNGVLLSSLLPRTEMTSEGYLTIMHLAKEDKGQYRCVANNSFGQAEDFTQLRVVEKQQNKIKASNLSPAGTYITVSPVDQRVPANTTVFFVCHASYSPGTDLVYTWLFNGHPIDFSRSSEYKMVDEETGGKTGLYVQHVNIRHTGRYECLATSSMSHDKKGAFLYVVVLPASATIHHQEVKRFAVVTGLSPGCGFRFRVTAVNNFGSSPPSLPTGIIQTLTAAPTIAPAHPCGGDGKVGDLTMRWTAMSKAQQAGGGFGYVLYWRRHTDTGAEPWSTVKLLGTTDHYTTLVGVENYFLEYDFKIQAFNDAGYGPNSTEVVIMSAEDLPATVPTDVRAEGYNGTAMEVTWVEVPPIREYARGKILGYQINYWHESEVVTDYKEFIRYEGQVTSGIVIGLRSEEFYYFTVQAYNSAGIGPISEYYYQETLLAPNENYRSACRHVVHDHHAHHTHIEVDPGVVYAVRVSAWSIGGYGKKSLTTYFTLEGDNVIVDYNLAQTVEAFRSSSPCLISWHTLPVFLMTSWVYLTQITRV
ncbi:contactin-2-like [Physella acuta]|uniref:contactin-2-like n=1 Tax=Physella acuta TaxID=109671 RepID=UPI0027DB89D4|nr:contactin-2-like [Physella acuta]